MNQKILEKNFRIQKNIFIKYIENIKKNMPVDIFSIINTTIVSNPYRSSFPKNFFLSTTSNQISTINFLFSSSIFYLKNFFYYFSYIISFIIYKIQYKRKLTIFPQSIGIDLFLLADNINKEGKFNDKYFPGLYKVLDKYKVKYFFIPRIYGIGRNPFKLIKLLKILKNDKRNFLFEFDLISITDFVNLLFLILFYPFKTLRLVQKGGDTYNKIFNESLIDDIRYQQFDVFSRYIFGKNISKINNIKKIYSWSEFQVIERSFNYGIRTSNNNIQINACQFFINYETYLNTVVYDIDYIYKYSPHSVLVNGLHYLKKRNNVVYKKGVSLRYGNIFKFKKENKDSKNILVLGSHILEDTIHLIESTKSIENIIFKSHPTISTTQLKSIPNNFTITQKNIYDLFKDVSLVISTASGTALEAVACGISVIIVASNDNLTANPLVEYGQGKIWDIAFSKDDVKILYNKLINFRKNHEKEITNISCWYKDNFFIEPNEENIVSVFELGRNDI